jgi:hypothetical protein
MHTEPGHLRQPPSPRRRGCWLIMIVGAALAVCGGAAVLLMTTVLGEPNEIRVDVQVMPDQPVAAQPFSVAVDIENVDLDPVTITGIGLDENLLDGLTLVSTDPLYRSSEDRSYPLIGNWTEYAFDQRLAGGETITVTLLLEAGTAGLYSGDVTVWIEADFLGLTLSRARRASLEIRVN